MKEPFEMMIKTSLEIYFVEVIVPQVRKTALSNSQKDFMDLSAREHLGLVLLSMFMSELLHKKYVPVTMNKSYDDGGISEVGSGIFLPVEQVYVYEGKWDNDAISGVKDAIHRKNNKGINYASGNILIIFSNANGEFNSESIELELKESNFETIVVIGPSGKSEFNYYINLVKKNKNVSRNVYELDINSINGLFNLISLN